MKKRKHGVRLLVVVYLLAVVVWLCCAAISLALSAGNRDLTTRELSVAGAADAHNIVPIDGWDSAEWLLTQDNDPQLLWKLGGTNVQQLIFDAKAVNAPSGEIVAYYTTSADEDFSEGKKLWAQQDASGRWVFEFGLKRVYNLRIDAGPLGGVIWRVQAITLNTPKTWYSFFVPSVQQVALLLLLPCFIWGMVTEVWAFIQPRIARRRFEKRTIY